MISATTLNKTNKTKMFKSLGIRCRRHTCKVILLTSLVWCVMDIVILLTYSDCSNGMGWGCHSATDNSNSAGHHSANHNPGKMFVLIIFGVGMSFRIF